MSKRDEFKARVGIILIGSSVVAGILVLAGCSQRSSNEISEMALECFKNKQGITIEFTPHPENKSEQKIN
jgi:hypothetical protein